MDTTNILVFPLSLMNRFAARNVRKSRSLKTCPVRTLKTFQATDSVDRISAKDLRLIEDLIDEVPGNSTAPAESLLPADFT